MLLASRDIRARLKAAQSSEKRLPKYLQLSEAILQLIDEDELKPGDRLPPEAVLAKHLPVSLGTIQKAFGILSELGVVRRIQRSGTVITERTDEIHDLWQFRFIDNDGKTILPVFSKVNAVERVRERGPWREFLSDDDLVKISREIDVDHRFKAINFFYLSFAQFGAMIEMPPAELEGVHIHAVIRRKFGVPTVRTNNRIVCTVIPDRICLQLDLPSAARGLECQILGFGRKDRPLMFQQVFIPADVQPLEFRELRPNSALYSWSG